MRDLIIYGRASQKEIKRIPIAPADESINLMELLLSNGIPVASSCNGDGVCLKCIATVNGEKVLTCQTDIQGIMLDHDSVTLILSYL